MKILCIGRNYAAHIAELSNEKPDEPVIFTKPDTAILKNNAPFYHPAYTNDIHHEVEVILRIGKEGKHIQPKFAESYIDGIGLGIDFTARDLQTKAKNKGLPWALAKGFDGSAPISEFLPVEQFPDFANITFSLSVNGVEKQRGNTGLMLFPFAEIISYLSTFITLKKGDIIFTGTPEGVSKIAVGDRLVGHLEGQEMFDFEVK